MCQALSTVQSLHHRSRLINKRQTRANRAGPGTLLGGREGTTASAREGGMGVNVGRMAAVVLSLSEDSPAKSRMNDHLEGAFSFPFFLSTQEREERKTEADRQTQAEETKTEGGRGGGENINMIIIFKI